MKSRVLSVLGIPVLALVLASCGTTGSSTPTTAASGKPAIPFGSPVLSTGNVVPASYKCESRKVWLPLRWGTLPEGTRELALYIVSFGLPTAAKAGPVKATINAESLVVGLKPTLHGLSPGRYPAGALVGVHGAASSLASICPRKGITGNLLFRIFALRRKLHLGRGTHPGNLINELNKEALNAGTLIVRYKPA